jgi:hypothetical protein
LRICHEPLEGARHIVGVFTTPFPLLAGLFLAIVGFVLGFIFGCLYLGGGCLGERLWDQRWRELEAAGC